MESQGPPGHVRLDTIRDQLKHLGYLTGPLSGLESWMLAGRGGPSSFLRINLIASLRAALIGGALLGLPATAAVAIANRPHVSAPRDLLLLFLYLATMLGAALGVLEFCTDTALAWMGRRGLVLVGRAEKLAARVGLLFFVGTTLYLACLVRSGRAALRSPGAAAGREGVAAWVVWIAAVIGALAVGHLIGRLARLGSLVALAAASGGAVLGERLALPARRRVMLPAGVVLVLLVLLAAGLLVFGPPGFYRLSIGSRPSIQRTELKGKLAVIGVDGLDAGWYDRMKPTAACPTLRRLESQGARYEIQAEGPRVPPAVWSTIATGRPSSQHGILGYQADRLPGLTVPLQERPESAPFTFSLKLLLPPLRPAPSPVSSGLRRARAVWEILAEFGVSTAVVNWWATWPADRSDGTVVSERAFTRFLAGSKPDRDVAPEALQADLAARFALDLEQVHRGIVSAGASAGSADDLVRASDDMVRTSEVIDGYHGLIARRLLGAGLSQAAFVYLPGIDIARARAGKQPPQPGRDLLLASVLANVDRILGEFVAQSGPDDLVLVIGDPGRGGDPGASGLLLIWGGRVNQGHRARVVSGFDLAPTFLSLAGFPTARDLPGSPVVDFLKVGDVATRLSPPIESYGSRPETSSAAPEDPFDREVLDRLRSLGYIQ